MRLSVQDLELLARVDSNYPQFRKFIDAWLLEELSELPSMTNDVQIFQGRCLALQELTKFLQEASGNAAKRNSAQPNHSTP